MDYRHGKVRMNVEVDRLSSLPDDLIHKILSFISMKDAIETSALSSRWRYIWTSMPYLNFSSYDFLTLREFAKFVNNVLLHRDNQIEASSIKLSFRGKTSQVFFKKILSYAFSHNIQQLDITCFHNKVIEFPFSLFSSQSLKHLTLTGYIYDYTIITPPTWDLPALTTLNLNRVTLSDESTDKSIGIFSKCPNLLNLTIKDCRTKGLNGFSICHPLLSNLTLEDGNVSKDVNVVAPQLEHLTIRNWSEVHVISTPNLTSLVYSEDNCYPLQISTDSVCSLDKVDLCIKSPYPDKENADKIVCLLQQLRNVKYLALNLEILKLLSSFLEVITHQPSPFSNLKSLKIYPSYITQEERVQPKVTISTEVTNYLLDSSPSATFTLVSHEEIRAVMNVSQARRLMKDLQVLLEECKENSETNTGHMQQEKTPMESHKVTTVHEQGEVEEEQDTNMQCHSEERMSQIKNYWEDLFEELDERETKTDRILTMLRKIRGLVTKLPASHRAKVQERFSCLSGEANTIMHNMMDHMSIKCNKQPRRLNFNFHELPTTS